MKFICFFNLQWNSEQKMLNWTAVIRATRVHRMNKCISKGNAPNSWVAMWRSGSWGQPGGSTISSQLQDIDRSQDWQILTTEPWAPIRLRRDVGLSHWFESVGKRKGREEWTLITTPTHDNVNTTLQKPQRQMKSWSPLTQTTAPHLPTSRGGPSQKNWGKRGGSRAIF